MSSYLLIESRDPYIFKDTRNSYSLATRLARAGHDVTLFLIQNAVLPVRKNAENQELLAAGQTGISVFADHFSLRERAIQLDEVCDEISVDDLDLVIDKLAAGAKSLWF